MTEAEFKKRIQGLFKKQEKLLSCRNRKSSVVRQASKNAAPPQNSVRQGKGVASSETNDSAHCFVRNDNDWTGCSSAVYCPGSGECTGSQSAGG
jgi:hypothetical protein